MRAGTYRSPSHGRSQVWASSRSSTWNARLAALKTCRLMLWSFGSVFLEGKWMLTSCAAASFSPIQLSGKVVSRLAWGDSHAMYAQAKEHRDHYRAMLKARDARQHVLELASRAHDWRFNHRIRPLSRRQGEHQHDHHRYYEARE